MKKGDVVKYKNPHYKHTYIVNWIEPMNDWVFVFGKEVPIQMSLMEVISESR